MTEQDILNAFLAGAKAERPPLRSDGARLYAGPDSIAEWRAGEVVIEPRCQGSEPERCKSLLKHAIMLRTGRNQEVRRLLRRGCRDLFRAAMNAHRRSGTAASGGSTPSRAEPSS